MMKQVMKMKRESLDGPLTRHQLHTAVIDLVRAAKRHPLGHDLDLDEEDLYPVFVLEDFCKDLVAAVADDDPAVLAVAIRDPDPLDYALRLHTAILETLQLLDRRSSLHLDAPTQQAIDILLRLARALPAMAGPPVPA